jgi:tetratricopeptide (TPR) repeat protein
MNHIVELSDEAKRVADSGHYADAAKLYRKVVDLIPVDEVEWRIIHYLAAAAAHLDARIYDEAIDDCRCAISLNPSDMSLRPDASIAWRSLGNAFLDAGQLPEAEIALQKSLALGATRSACIYLAVVYLKTRNFSDAEQYCRRAITLDPEFEEAYYNLGNSLSEQGRTDEALQAFQTAYTLDPHYAGPHREAGMLLLKERKYAEAETHLRKALELAPNDERAIALMRCIVGRH